MPPFNGLWIGRAEREEFKPLRDWLMQFTSEVVLNFSPTVEDVSKVLKTTSPPDIVIIGESWPDEFNAADVSDLLTMLPLARFVCVTGAWSEAVGRTRIHWPAAWRVLLWDAIPRIERELMALAACRSGTTDSAADFPPWTASRQETWQWQQGNISPTSIDSADRLRVDLREIADPALSVWLDEALRSAGHTVTTDAADVLLFDVEPWSPVIQAQVQNAIALLSHAIPVALTGWSTPELRSVLQAMGVMYIVDKLSPHSLLHVMRTIAQNSLPVGRGSDHP